MARSSARPSALFLLERGQERIEPTRRWDHHSTLITAARSASTTLPSGARAPISR